MEKVYFQIDSNIPEQTISKGILLSFVRRKESLRKINKHSKNDALEQFPNNGIPKILGNITYKFVTIKL